MSSVLVKKQVKKYGPRSDAQLVQEYGKGAQLTANVRYDDECGNGHNSFAITGDVVTDASKRRRDIEAGGCLHEDIARLFPELAHTIKWHLTSSDGPMHYIANAVYFAGDRDYSGRAKGEPCAWEHRIYFGDSPIGRDIGAKLAEFIAKRMLATGYDNAELTLGDHGEFRVQAIAHERDPKTYGTHYTLLGFGDKWHEAPFRHERDAQEFAKALNTCTVRIQKVATAFSEGKERELDKARNAAVWPDATDEDLTAPGLKERLEARQAALIAEFRRVVEGLGFTF